MSRLPVLLLAVALHASGQSYREKLLTAQLQQDPRNLPLILRLAALKLEDASAITNDAARGAHLDEVQILYLRANAVDPRNVDALYHLGVVSWMKVFPALSEARRETAMEPETPGPVRGRFARAALNARYRADIDYAIACLEQAIAIEPSNNDAMSYLQMAYRARADFKDTRVEWDEDQSAAGRWREKAFEVGSVPPVPQAPQVKRSAPTPAIAPWSLVFLPSAITVDSQEMESKLTHWLPGSCPAGLPSGTLPLVTLAAVIDRDGSVLYLKPNSGPDLAMDAAIEAAKQWSYKPTLLNGKAVMVKTTLVVPFNACPGN